jgi:dihydrolipoamide dehydrogenase
MTADDDTHETEILIVGAGPGGYVAAIRCAQLGMDVTLADAEHVGGACLNYGCIPSKALISATNRVDDVTDVEEMGIYADPYVDLSELVDWKDGVVDRLTRGIESLCRAQGITIVEGRISFVDEHRADVEGADDLKAVDFETAIVATGSRPMEVPGFSFEDAPVLDSRQALALEEIPERLVVVGAGYIGMELSGVFAKLGVDVTVVEMLDSVLPTYPDELSDPVRDRMEELGVSFHFGQRASEWRASDDGIVVVTEDRDGVTSEFDADRVLVAVGRVPTADTLDLDAVGIEPNDDGTIPVDEDQRTSVENLFAIGDVAGEPMLAHAASHEGLIAAERIAGNGEGSPYATVPAVVFTEPEIVTVGLSDAAAADRSQSTVTGEFPLRASGRALTTGHTEGFVRLVADAESHEVLGGAVVGLDASELSGELTLAVDTGRTLEELAATIHAHPTLSEAIMEAAGNALGRPIHTNNR